MTDIIWPDAYLPGTTDYYIANETIVAGLSAAHTWSYLADTTHWPATNAAIGAIRFHDGAGPVLRIGARFEFAFGGTPVQAQVNEYVAPAGGQPGRLGWHGWVEHDGRTVVDAHCAWLVEDLSGGRVRVVWQESLVGPAAREMAAARPNPALAVHQEWVDGIAGAALAASPVPRAG